MAGAKFIILNSESPAIFRPKPIKSTEPTLIISVTTASARNGARKVASNVRPPSITSTGMADKATPAPSDDARRNPVIPSSKLLI